MLVIKEIMTYNVYDTETDKYIDQAFTREDAEEIIRRMEENKRKEEERSDRIIEAMRILPELRKMSKEQIRNEWILKDKPCHLIYGFEWKGAKPKPLTDKEKALELLAKSTRGTDYHTYDFTIDRESGLCVLEFAIYSEHDML